MFKGSFVALVSPMGEQGDIDFDALQGLVDFHLAHGTDGFVIAGTTGESAALTTAEFESLLSAVVRQVDGAIPVVAGTGSANTEKTIRMTRRAGTLGADAALVVTPYYNRPMQNGLVAHFTAVADATNIPLLMYNVPARTAVDMAPDTTLQLAGHPNIAGIKEALPDLQRIARLAQESPDSFSVLSGDDGSCCAAMQAGASGVVSVAANVAPGRMHELCELSCRGESGPAGALNESLQELFAVLAIESNPIPVKRAVYEMGLIPGGIRLPLLPLAERHRSTLRNCLQKLQLIQVKDKG